MVTFEQVLEHFGGATKLARKLEDCSAPAVSQWRGFIPPRRVHEIAALSRGKFTVEQLKRLTRKRPAFRRKAA